MIAKESKLLCSLVMPGIVARLIVTRAHCLHVHGLRSSLGMPLCGGGRLASGTFKVKACSEVDLGSHMVQTHQRNYHYVHVLRSISSPFGLNAALVPQPRRGDSPPWGPLCHSIVPRFRQACLNSASSVPIEDPSREGALE